MKTKPEEPLQPLTIKKRLLDILDQIEQAREAYQQTVRNLEKEVTNSKLDASTKRPPITATPQAEATPTVSATTAGNNSRSI